MNKTEERNCETARQGGCDGCVFIHIGQEVNHNHCDLSRSNPYGWDVYEKKANGRVEYINDKKVEISCRFRIQKVTHESCPKCGLVGSHINEWDSSGVYHKRKRKCDSCGYTKTMLV